jgi:hypothetical protein
MSEELINSNEIQVPADTRELRQTVAEQAKALARSALKLEQAALFDEEPFEEALLLSPEEIKKRYTGSNGEKMVWRQETALYMLGRQCPAQDIARVLHMNLRVISALAAQNGRKLAGFTDSFVNELMASAGADISMSETKRHEASYKDLGIVGGIKLTHVANLKLASVGGQVDGAIDVTNEDEELRKFRDRISQLKPANVTEVKP